MNKRLIKSKGIAIFGFFIVLSFLFLPAFLNTKVFAQGLVSGPVTSAVDGLENPIAGVDTLTGFVKKILDIVMTVGVPAVALAIIYSGFLFVKAQGDPKALETAKQTLVWTVIGAAVLLASWIIAQAVCETVSDIGGGVFGSCK